MAGKPKFQKRITMRSVGLSPEDLEAIALANKKETPVLRVVGKVVDCEAGSTNIGPFIKFKGEFAAFNLVDGEQHRGQTAIFAGPAEMLVSKMLESAKKQDKDAVAQIAFDITVKEHKSTYEKGWKFTYGVSSLMDTPAEDSLTLLAEQFGAMPLLTDKKKK